MNPREVIYKTLVLGENLLSLETRGAATKKKKGLPGHEPFRSPLQGKQRLLDLTQPRIIVAPRGGLGRETLQTRHKDRLPPIPLLEVRHIPVEELQHLAYSCDVLNQLKGTQ